MTRHLGDKNYFEGLNSLDAHDKRYRKLGTLFLLVWYHLFQHVLVGGVITIGLVFFLAKDQFFG